MRAMFSTIAPRYDFITRIFSYGMDRRWKQRGVEMAGLPDGAVVLDLASGTGDFSHLVTQRCPGARSVAVDLTERMLRLARASGIAEAACADATILPFADQTFDAVFIGYGLRNFPDLNAALREIHGRPRIYTYIPDSLRSFISLQDFAERLRGFGYASVKAHGFILGGIGLHWAAKAENRARLTTH